MSRAQTYLKTVLTEEQYEEYRRQCNLDSRDSVARGKLRHIRQWEGKGQYDERVASAKAWLRKNGYIDEAGEWTNKTFP